MPDKEAKPAAGRRASGGDSNLALVIVESPAKAKTISKYLGPGYIVESSIGHIRDLPSRASEIPEQYRKEKWARIGVDVDNDFRPLYVVSPKKRQQVSKLKGLLKGVSRVFLATDEDREGEAIAWHLIEELKPKVPVKRMVFDEITRTAIQKAVENPRALDEKLVQAQEARRILDRLYGYEVSPVLWRKIAPKLSAGRVQSVATRLVVTRERERMRFRAIEYWDIEATLRTPEGGQVLARMTELAGKRIATGKDFSLEGLFTGGADTLHLDERAARELTATLARAAFKVAAVTERPFTQRPSPPFITSTLQQEAARKLRLPVGATMRIAQSLYENGHITYMRTDSTNLSSQAVNAARAQIAEMFGQQHVPDQPRVYATKAKGAQEAHEAIRPAGDSFRKPESLRGALDPNEMRVYELIWQRTMASQMKDASGLRTSVRIEAPAGDPGVAAFSASGKVITFPGFLQIYGRQAPVADAQEEQEQVRPKMSQGDGLTPVSVEPRQHATVPPARYNEASLIKELEERGIGRPSTYASIIGTILGRGYVWRKGSALVPTLTAFAVTNLMERHFAELVDFEFTANMENDLDAIAAGELQSRPWLRAFYFGQDETGNGNQDIAHVGLKRRIGAGSDQIDPRAVSSIEIGQNDQGQQIIARIGRYGPYLEIGDQRINIPDTLPADELSDETIRRLVAEAGTSDKPLGNDPATGKPVYLRRGRFGPYVQLGDAERTPSGKLKAGGKPRMASLWPGMSEQGVSLEDALLLLSFPRVVGVHPQSGEEITVQDGKYGPYLKAGKETRSLENHEQLRTLGLDGAMALLAQPKRGRQAGAASSTPARELGKHPSSGADIKVKAGRFGPYVSDGVVNATIPRGTDPASVTLEQSLELLAAREAKMREQGKDPRAEKPKRAARPRKKKE